MELLGGEAFLYGPGLPERVAAATGGRGVDRVFDSVGKATQAQSLAMLAPYGELIYFGEASGPPDLPEVPGISSGRIRIAGRS